MIKGYAPLNKIITHFPREIFSSSDFINNLGLTEYQVNTGENQGLCICGQVIYFDDILIGLNDFKDFYLLFLNNNDFTEISFTINTFPDFLLILTDLSFTLRIQNAHLLPVKKENGLWVKDIDDQGQVKPLDIVLNNISLSLDLAGNLEMVLPAGFPQINLPPVQIGESGLVLELNGLQPLLSLKQPPPEGLTPGSKGFLIESAIIYLPAGFDLSIAPASYELENFLLGSSGLAGIIRGNWQPAYNGSEKIFSGQGAGRLFDVPFGLKSLECEFTQNVLIKAGLAGDFLLPFFDAVISIKISLGFTGSLSICINSVQPQGVDYEQGILTLEKDNVLSLAISSLRFEVDDGLKIYLSGKITPLLPVGTGLEWPSFEIQELCLDSSGNINLAGGWLDLPCQYAIDFYGFQMEITKIALGKNQDQGRWLGFSCAVKLIEDLPAGISLEGLRITWYDDPQKQAEIALGGVDVEFSIPDTLYFKGQVSYNNFIQNNVPVHRFDGSIKLELTCLNLELDAFLVIGNAQEAGQKNSFFAIYLDVELPVGIPLFNTGLALYGMAGLTAFNMEPDKKAGEEWYEGWYKRPETGVIDLKSKWKYAKQAFALGAGITLGTLADNGYVFNGRMLLVVSFPGPVLLIEGRANLLRKRTCMDEEPLFKALAVLDTKEQELLIGLDARYKYGGNGQLIDIRGSTEAYFKAPDDWHIYIGEKEPRDRRIRAQVLSLFEGDTYFMLDCDALQMGAWIGWDKKWKFGPLKVILEAWLESNVCLSWHPVHFYGDIWAHGKTELSVFGFGVGLSIDARLAAEIFKPYHILGEFSVGINLPWPLPDFDVDISLEWGPEKQLPPIPNPLKEASIEHFKTTATCIPPVITVEDSQSGGVPPCNQDIPTVPLDARPKITFNKSVHDMKMIGVNCVDPVPEFEIVGNPENGQEEKGSVKVKYLLEDVILYKKDYETGEYRAAAGKDIPAVQDIYASWAPVPQIPAGTPAPGTKPATANTKLCIWSKNPFDHFNQIDRTWDVWVTKNWGNYPCPPLPATIVTTYNFDDLDLGQVIMPPFNHPQDDKLLFNWESPQFIFVVKNEAQIQDFKQALYFIALDQLIKDNLKLKYYCEVFITLPVAVKKVVVYIISPHTITITAKNSEALVLNTQTGNQEISLSASANQITHINIYGELPFTFVALSTYKEPAAEEFERYQELAEHITAEMTRWSGEGYVFAPFSEYCLQLNTRYITQGLGDYTDDEDFNSSKGFSHFIYFNTDGPPGISRLPEDGNENNSTGLFINDLKYYVKQTVPFSLPGKGMKPILAKPVYRAYDIGIEFNEDYVELMYKQATSDLGLYLIDNNNEPVRDADGKIIVLNNYWAKAAEQYLSQSEVHYINQINNIDCADIDETIIPLADKINALKQSHVLKPGCLYEARLIPLLFNDDFSLANDNWYEISQGTNDTPACWQLLTHEKYRGEQLSIKENMGYINDLDYHDAAKINSQFDYIYIQEDTNRITKLYKILDFNPDSNRVTLDGCPCLPDTTSAWEIPAYGSMVQTSNIWGGFAIGSDPVKPGTMLLLKNYPGIDQSDERQPANWHNYRITVVLRSIQDDAIGVVFRYSDKNTEQYYRFSMDSQRQYRRLVKVINNVHTVLAQDDFSFTQNIDYRIIIELQDACINVFQDEKLIFAVNDDSIDNGTIGLYCWANMGAQFSQINVDNLNTYAKPVYQFQFITSNYTNFFHHMHSYQDEAWKTQAGNQVKVLDFKNLAQTPSSIPDEAEFRNYNRILKQIGANQAKHNNSEVQVVKVLESSKTAALWVRSPEPFIWERLNIQLFKPKKLSVFIITPKQLKITGLYSNKNDPQQEYISILARKNLDINGYEIQYAEFKEEFFNDEKYIAAKIEELAWQKYYKFQNEHHIQAGTLFYIYSCGMNNEIANMPNIEKRYIAPINEAGVIHFKNSQFLIRIVDKKNKIIHCRSFYPTKDSKTCKIIRKRDGTGFFIFHTVSPGYFLDDDYRLKFTFSKKLDGCQTFSQAGDTASEVVEIDIPRDGLLF